VRQHSFCINKSAQTFVGEPLCVKIVAFNAAVVGKWELARFRPGMHQMLELGANCEGRSKTEVAYALRLRGSRFSASLVNVVWTRSPLFQFSGSPPKVTAVAAHQQGNLGRADGCNLMSTIFTNGSSSQ
jgi:hypothetical protein